MGYIKIYKYNSSWKKLKVSGPFSSEFCSLYFLVSPPRSQLLPLLLLWKINSWSVVTYLRTAQRRGLPEPSQPMNLRPSLWLTVTNARDPIPGKARPGRALHVKECHQVNVGLYKEFLKICVTFFYYYHFEWFNMYYYPLLNDFWLDMIMVA